MRVSRSPWAIRCVPFDQLDDRAANDAIHKRDGPRADNQHNGQGQPEGSPAGITERQIERFERHLHVHDAEDRLLGDRTVAAALRALRFVFDRAR